MNLTEKEQLLVFIALSFFMYNIDDVLTDCEEEDLDTDSTEIMNIRNKLLSYTKNSLK